MLANERILAPRAIAASAYWALAQTPKWPTPAPATNDIVDRKSAAAPMSALFRARSSSWPGPPPPPRQKRRGGGGGGARREPGRRPRGGWGPAAPAAALTEPREIERECG